MTLSWSSSNCVCVLGPGVGGVCEAERYRHDKVRYLIHDQICVCACFATGICHRQGRTRCTCLETEPVQISAHTHTHTNTLSSHTLSHTCTHTIRWASPTLSLTLSLTSFTTTSPVAVMTKSVLGLSGGAPLGPIGIAGGGTFARGITCRPGAMFTPAEQKSVRTADLDASGLCVMSVHV